MTWRRWGLGAVMASALASFAPVQAFAETIVEDGVVTRMEPLPKRLSGIDVEERLEQALPLGLTFTDTSGHPVALERYVNGERPVIFTLNYSDCPMLCSLQLSGLSSAVQKLDRTLGKDFEIVTVSLDPAETSERARATEARYRSEVGTVSESAGWHFLTGSSENIAALASALGIGYGYNAERKEYVHPAALVISTPNGRISRYLYGVEYHPKTLSLSLVEAAEGKIGSSVDRLILYCFHYDETEGRYAPMAMNIMRLGGSATALALGGFLGAFWFRQSRRRGARGGEGAAGSAPADASQGVGPQS